MDKRDKGEIARDAANEITEQKEREGMYPNELDSEMKGYKYGDRLTPMWYGGWGNGTYNGGYSGHYDANKTHYNGRDLFRNKGTFAPDFDPNSHFESPYYHYEDRGYWSGYSNNGYGYWGYEGYNSPRWAFLT